MINTADKAVKPLSNTIPSFGWIFPLIFVLQRSIILYDASHPRRNDVLPTNSTSASWRNLGVTGELLNKMLRRSRTGDVRDVSLTLEYIRKSLSNGLTSGGSSLVLSRDPVNSRSLASLINRRSFESHQQEISHRQEICHHLEISHQQISQITHQLEVSHQVEISHQQISHQLEISLINWRSLIKWRDLPGLSSTRHDTQHFTPFWTLSQVPGLPLTASLPSPRYSSTNRNPNFPAHHLIFLTPVLPQNSWFTGLLRSGTRGSASFTNASDFMTPRYNFGRYH